MPKPMKYRDVERALLRQGCVAKMGKGDHEKWYCPCGQHSTVITRAGTVSPGVIGQAINRLACLPKGWLQ